MVGRIGQSGSLAQEAIQAALRSQADAAQRVRDASSGVAAQIGGGVGQAQPGQGSGFVQALEKGLAEVDGVVSAAERLGEDVASGKIQDFHEIAARIKTADLSFKFALEVRNKLIDAYREVMRMNV